MYNKTFDIVKAAVYKGKTININLTERENTMHYHLEIIMPPTNDVEQAVKEILAQFDESGTDEDGEPNRYTFWDWWVIGGRWAGEKVKAQLDQDKLKEFYDELNKLNITVSGLQAGKQELKPASQIPAVDALWLKFFPDSKVKACPLFNHYNDQYQKVSDLPDDVMKYSDIPEGLTASHVIVAKDHWDKDVGGLEAAWMMNDSVYNGVNFTDTKWDGTFKGAMEMYIDSLKNYRDEYKEKYTPNDDWIVVTVDYHS